MAQRKIDLNLNWPLPRWCHVKIHQQYQWRLVALEGARALPWRLTSGKRKRVHNSASVRSIIRGGVSGTLRVPMLTRILVRYDGAEILMMAAGVLFVVGIAFAF